MNNAINFNILEKQHLTEQDINILCSWSQDVEIQFYLHLCPTLISNILHSNAQIFYYTAINSQDIICCCWLFNNQMSWMCNPKYRNCGYMTTLLQKVLDMLSIDKIEANIDSKNIASQRVAEKCGFIKEPIRKFYTDKIMYKYVYTK